MIWSPEFPEGADEMSGPPGYQLLELAVEPVFALTSGCIRIPGQIPNQVEKLGPLLADEKTVRGEGGGSPHRSPLCFGRANN